ncbi:membrane protein [Mycoplasma ovis str. Michigan]|uniref:Membrane protein n=1 Tax=Mycoplasma ovis str. Michigan TaxID=1415773 RepID=A0ABM5P0N5_9MOLU|nr:hypothetical protein [Mycoplasma ovis]AHC39956.1 membrane protein [Mycoplasma ovis str. Michigan]
MRISFNLGLFKEQLREDLSVFEFSFLKRVFSHSAFYFGAFGLLVSSLTALAESSWLSGIAGNGYFVGVGGALALFTGLALMFYYLPRYHNNPLEVTPKFVKRAYFCLICTYGIVFCVLFQGLKLISLLGKGSSTWMSSSLMLGIVIFGSSLVAYAIPVLIGLGMRKMSSVFKLSRFLRACYVTYFVLALVGFIVALSMSNGGYHLYNALMTLLFGTIIFISPILSVYRMKTVIRYIDPKDMVAIKRWELFFVFEALAQLMQMAVFLTRLFASFCMGCIGGGAEKR